MIYLQSNSFKVELKFLGEIHNRVFLHFIFWDYYYSQDPLFRSGGFSIAQGNKAESIVSISHLLGFLSCTFKDVDDEYFAQYTIKQVEWLKNCAWRIRWLKDWQQDLQELGAIADELYYFSNSDEDIDWEEWENIFPVRLRYFCETFDLSVGSPDLDNNHRGYWGASSLCQGMSHQECWDTVMSMKNMIGELLP